MNRKSKVTRWLALIVAITVSATLSYAAVRHEVAAHWGASSNAGLWEKAAKLEPDDADRWFQLGRYYQLDFEHGDLEQALVDYRRAVSVEPQTALYWLELAGTYESVGNSPAAEAAYLAARQDHPISGEVAWRYGNFLLRQNRTNEAFAQVQRAVQVEPALAQLAVSRVWYSSQDVERILNSALPATADAYWGAAQFFVSSRQPVAAMASWRRFAAYKTSFPIWRVAPLVDLLIQSGQAEDAKLVWQQALAGAGIMPARAMGGSLIWDGGFEGNVLNAGFTWRYQAIAGADLHLDEQTVHSGRRSLQVDFDGTANVDFGQVWQFVVVEPGVRYRFSAYTRADELTTDHGIHFEIRDANHAALPYPSTPDVVGTQPWALDNMEFTVAPQTHLLQIVLRRQPSGLLGNKIKGTVWVDDVSLIPIGTSGKQ